MGKPGKSREVSKQGTGENTEGGSCKGKDSKEKDEKACYEILEFPVEN